MAQPAIRFNNNPQYLILKLEQLTTLTNTQLPLTPILLTPVHIGELTKSLQEPLAMSPLPQPESPSTTQEEHQ